ncbi:hypothetical protein CEXT_267941 [Caerostris extrusa]|uniref:Uncharacterized protein n=1 Tax=Caerostris extrusa TaxID=172846 RepID=A0AAV4TK55_CAEEX|nr:hypothetical protein CEXT_267941 [Caerostris extrusa]
MLDGGCNELESNTSAGKDHHSGLTNKEGGISITKNNAALTSLHHKSSPLRPKTSRREILRAKISLALPSSSTPFREITGCLFYFQ